MSDSRLELGLDDRGTNPRDAPPRRRLFEGGSGVVPSSFHHNSRQAARDLEIEASSVREQAASLASRAVLEGWQTANDSIAEEPNEQPDPFSHTAEEDVYSSSPQASGNFYRASTNPPSFTQAPSVASNAANLSPHWGANIDTNSPVSFLPYSDSPDVSVNDLMPIASPVQTILSQPGEADTGEPARKPEKITVVKMVSYIPAVAVGTLLNILDGLSYGMILLPLSHAAFAGTESIGLSLFYISTIIAQLVFSLGGSGFKACIGSEMIEIVPFFHSLALTIAGKLADRPNEEILATTVSAFAVSCLVTGLTFFLLGWLKLGAIVGFFPMHILLGCIGGVGWFLIATGFEVSARIEGGVDYNWATLAYLFRNWETLAQWSSCLGLGCLLMFCERKLHHPLVVPTILVGTFALFHLVVAVVPQLSLDGARQSGWVFPAQSSGEQPWWYVYTLYRPSLIHWRPILESFPVMLALTFFGLIHVPINIPALAAATKEDQINVNRELIAHGLSNTLSGLLGSIQNYLVYTNSVMFVKSGADSPLAGVMLTFATAAVMLAGPGIIGYIPVIVVASLIFMMGFDLITEALVDTYGKVRKQDYATMVTITLIMGCYDFVVGIVAGIMLACLFFVITSARRSPVQSTMTGAQAHSTVIRHPLLQKYLDKVGQQVYIMRLTGALFFGTNGRLEREVRNLTAHNKSEQHFNGSVLATIRYLVIDLENVNDIDYCTVDTFLKLKRLMDASGIRLVLSGAEAAGHKIRGLKAVDLVPEVVDHSDPLSVRVFATLNIALSWCENQFIKEYYQQRGRFRKRFPLDGSKPGHLPGQATSSVRNPGNAAARPHKSVPISVNDPQWAVSGHGLEGSPGMHAISTAHGAVPASTALLGTTPRSNFIRSAARHAAQEDLTTIHRWNRHEQPLVLLMQIVDSISSQDVEFWEKLVPFLTPKVLKVGDQLPPGFHLVESGSFHIKFDSGYYESAVAGTALGELAENTLRKAVIRAESEAKVWMLQPLSRIRAAPDGPDLVMEMLNVYLVIMSDRYQRMTDYYRIAD